MSDRQRLTEHRCVWPCSLASRRSRRRASGSVMIVAVLILLVVTATALLLATSMRVEVRASANHAEQAAATAAAEGAVRYAMSVLAETPGQLPPEDELLAEGVIVGDAAYWLIRPASDGSGGYEPGIADEAGKLHLNVATLEMLLELPEVTDDMAESLITWRSTEEEAMDLPGAGAEHYLLQDPPYLPRHAPLESVEELLLIRGWSRETLVRAPPADATAGRGSHLTGSGAATRPTLTSSAATEADLYDLLTVYSRQRVEDPVNLNDQDRTALRELLETELSAERFDTAWAELGLEGRGGRSNGPSFDSLLDFYSRSGLTEEEFDALAPRLVTGDDLLPLGQVNPNTASESVLACLPGLDANDAAALVNARAGRSPDEAGLAWIVDLVGDAKAAEVWPHLTGRSYQFTVDVVAIGRTGRAFKRYRVVIDMAENPPRVLRWSDWTAHGWPLDPAVREALRAGVALEDAVAMHGKVAR